MSCRTLGRFVNASSPSRARLLEHELHACRRTESSKSHQTKYFSTSQRLFYPRDNNPKRGISPLRRTGLPRKLSVSDLPLPKPVTNPRKHSKIQVDDNHGLWGFFNDKKLLMTPEEEHSHGRAWTVEELRKKSWEDLHRLWWVCVKERNRIKTGDRERERMSAGYGAAESLERDEEVRKTMRGIKHALTERFYSWEHARKLALDDVTVNLSGRGPAYEPYKQTLADEAQSLESNSQSEAPAVGTKVI